MQLIRTLKITIILLIIAVNSHLFSQKIASPLEPEVKPIQREVGIILGVGPNWQTGSFVPTCTKCSFENGTKTGISIGGLYEQDVTPFLQAGLAIIYDSRGINASYREIEATTAVSPNTGDTVAANVQFRHQATSGIGFLTAMPYLKYSPFKFLFIKLGYSLSYVVSSSILHTKELLQNSVLLNDGTTATVSLTKGGTLAVIEDGPFPNINKFQMALEPIIGLNFNLSKNVFLSPGYQFTIPLTNMTSTGDNFKIYSWRIFIELRVALSMRDNPVVKGK